MLRLTEGDAAWLTLLVFIVAYDTWALFRGRETLSASFDRSLADPVRRPATIAVWAVLTTHLFDASVRRFLSTRREI